MTMKRSPSAFLERERLFFSVPAAFAVGLISFCAIWGCNLNQRDETNGTEKSSPDGSDSPDHGQNGDGAVTADGQTEGMDGSLLPADAHDPEDASTELPDDLDDAGPTDCVPESIDCINDELCGPVIEHCSGAIVQCGGCSDGLVCDLEFNTCIVPKVNCEDLGAECGRTKNSCGERLDCGGCPDEQECDPDTNTCVPCDTSVTCENLGYQCGEAWLGCGPKINKTDCGSCEEGGCNDIFKTCEPDCTPELSPQELCEAAGAECGSVSDGCQGLADCGDCPEGQDCGILGVANRCSEKEPAVECIAANRECGTLNSVCGEVIDCGDCEEEGEVCRDNGTCGPPCEPLRCDSDYADKCGSQLDDGCEGVLNCDCLSGLACDAAASGEIGSCVEVNTCLDYADADGDGDFGEVDDICSNGSSGAFPDGIGGQLRCSCNSGLVCVDDQTVVSGEDTGTCCQPSVCPNPADRTTVPCQITDPCTGAVRSCCRSSEHCEGDYCQPNLQCDDHPEYEGLGGVYGGENAQCSNGYAPDPFYRYEGDTRGLECNCIGADLYCVDAGVIVSGSTVGECCLNSADCGGGPSYAAGCREPNSCTNDGEPAEDCCGPNTCCATPEGDPDDVAGTVCKPELTCATLDPPATGAEGEPCSNGWVFDDGCEGNLRCRCDSGLVCVTGGQVVTNQQEGICCRPNTCDDTAWEADCTVPNGCIDGQSISCCASNQYCSDPATKLCEPILTCSYYGANGNVGQPCNGPSDLFPRGDGTYNDCPCSTSLGRTNNTCIEEPTSTYGWECSCTPVTCNGDCRNHGLPDQCGGSMQCPCSSGEACSSLDGECYPIHECDDYTNRALGSPCSDVPTLAFPILEDGNTASSNLLDCSCIVPVEKPNTVCEGYDGTSAGSCVCNPETDCGGQTADDIPDGCGGYIEGCGG